MSLLLPSTAVSSPSNPVVTTAATRHDQQRQGNPDNFGEALARSLMPAAEQAEKTAAKALHLPPARRQTDKPEGDIQDLVNSLGLAFFALEGRTPKAALADASETPSALSTLSATTAPRLSTPSTPGPEAVATSLVAADQDDASQNPLQIRLTPVSDTRVLVAVGGNISVQASAPNLGFAEQAGKHNGRGSTLQGDSTKMDTRLVPTSTRGASQVANHVADLEREATAPLITSTTAQQDSQLTADTTPPVNWGSSGAQSPVNASTASASTPPSVMTASLAPEVGSNEWSKSLGAQVVQMGKAGHQVAELQLNPPGLGPLKVTLSMNDQQIQAVFVSAHSSVRAAVEAALPQLRSALADSGISLGNTSVGAESQQQTAFSSGRDNPNPNLGHRGSYRTAETIDTSVRIADRATLEPVGRNNGIGIDTYA